MNLADSWAWLFRCMQTTIQDRTSLTDMKDAMSQYFISVLDALSPEIGGCLHLRLMQCGDGLNCTVMNYSKTGSDWSAGKMPCG